MVLGVPAGVIAYLAHREPGREGASIFINHGFKAQPPAQLRGITNPIVSFLKPWLGRISNIEVTPPPHAITLSLQGFIHQAARHGYRRTI